MKDWSSVQPRDWQHPFQHAGQTHPHASAIQPTPLPCCATFPPPPSEKRPAHAAPSTSGIQGAEYPAVHPWLLSTTAAQSPVATMAHQPPHSRPITAADPARHLSVKPSRAFAAANEPGAHPRQMAPPANEVGVAPQAYRSPHPELFRYALR